MRVRQPPDGALRQTRPTNWPTCGRPRSFYRFSEAKLRLDLTGLAAFKAARARLTNLRDELAQLMGADDERWYAFGFEKPSDSASPETPENMVVTLGAPGSRTLLCDWDDARRADNYRLRAVVKATGAQVFSELVADSQGIITLPNLAAGTELDITVPATTPWVKASPPLPSPPRCLKTAMHTALSLIHERRSCDQCGDVVSVTVTG